MRLMWCVRVRPGSEISVHYFSCSGGPNADLTGSVPGHVMLNLCFCIQCDLLVTSCVWVCLGREMSTLFFMLEWAQCGSHKKRVGTRYAKLVFFHLVRFVGHMVCSVASGA
jgi:hypothetical protein